MVDIVEVPHDEVLAGLRVATDSEAMRELLAPYFGPQVQLLQVKLGRFTYKPGRNARFAYRLKLLDRDRELATRHVVHGRMEPLADAAHLHKKMSRRDWTTPAYGPPLLYFGELGLVLWGFPNDPKLPGVEMIAGPAGLLPLVPRIPALARLAPVRCESAVVKYVPGKRLVMRHKLTAGDGRRHLVYSKTYAHDNGGAILAVMRHLWEHGKTDPMALTCPQPLAYLDDARTLVLGALPGTGAVAELHGEGARAAMEQTGRGLASVHASGVRGLEPWGEAHEFENLLKATDTLQRYDAGLAPAVTRIRALAQAGLAAAGASQLVPIHGAFRFTQLLAYRGRLALIDFDGFRSGNPACDAGSFIAHLYYLHAKDELPLATVREAATAFASSYRSVHPEGLPEPALRWYAAAILVSKHAQKCVKRMKDDGDTKIAHMLERAERWLSGTESPV